MKRFFLFLPFIVILIFGINSYGQGLKFGVGGGLSMVQSPDRLTNSAAEGGSGFGSEYHFGLKAKLSIPLVPVTPVGFLNYHLLSGDDDISQSILSLGVGVNIELIPGPLSPYGTIDLQYNSFGDTEIGSQSFDGYSRTGLGIGAGIEFNLLPMVDLDLSAKYNMMNLMGKAENEETVGIITVNLTFMIFGI